MPDDPVWEVGLGIHGTLGVNTRVRLRQPKGLRIDDTFLSDVILENSGMAGMKVTVTVKAPKVETAREAAMIFIGQMVDVISLQFRLPLTLKSYPPYVGNMRYLGERAVLRSKDVQALFREARLLALAEPTFLRALNWHRKGLTAENPFDKFHALWKAMALVADRYHPPDKLLRDAKSQVWYSFQRVWGAREHWPALPSEGWIDESHAIWQEIERGEYRMDAEAIEMMMGAARVMEDVAHRFLTDWRERLLDLDLSAELAALYRLEAGWESRRRGRGRE